jgi:hypothetical protein
LPISSAYSQNAVSSHHGFAIHFSTDQSLKFN